MLVTLGLTVFVAGGSAIIAVLLGDSIVRVGFGVDVRVAGELSVGLRLSSCKGNRVSVITGIPSAAGFWLVCGVGPEVHAEIVTQINKAKIRYVELRISKRS